MIHGAYKNHNHLKTYQTMKFLKSPQLQDVATNSCYSYLLQIKLTLLQ